MIETIYIYIYVIRKQYLKFGAVFLLCGIIEFKTLALTAYVKNTSWKISILLIFFRQFDFRIGGEPNKLLVTMKFENKHSAKNKD